MKTMAMLAAVTILAGCAATPQGLRIGDVREPAYFRGERTIPLTFPKIQMALFKHQAACGASAKFTLDPRQTAYATITEMPEPSASYEHAIVVDLTQYQSTMMAEERSKAQVYSYYADSGTKARIEQLFQSIMHPEICPQPGG
ncbi:hypothetical protein [Pollutimonas sp. M17]|uniref:hypothetical protein n=1 Tax=Pollutimonas sp. M17 TaxID=2962065 RepID=UPI0021F3FF85|nr:hypothetical protein [Pollutimonas sp. M17]UYO92565.1 hypothetical protein OEG81_11680 [Pollutimonas sp. M17]HWK69743.1 hypothetical protein [Burkholderiaceae bacterium]